MPAPGVTFSARSARWVAGAAVLSLLASFYLLLMPSELSRVHSVDADGYSRSAIGHSGILQLLDDLGEPVLQLRQLRDLGECGLFVIAEPGDIDEPTLHGLQGAIEQARVTLLVLPKRAGRADPEAPRWIGSDALIPLAEVGEVLRQLLGDELASEVVVARQDEPSGWSRAISPDVAPTLSDPVQLLAKNSSIDPLIWCEQGVLLGMVGDLFVLSDPDVVANHGLHRGDNAALVLGALRWLKADGAIVFDETSHGHRIDASIWTEAGRFPLVLVPVHLLLLLALALWTAAGRFGTPRAVPAAIEAGKRFLIENIVNLLQRGGRHGPQLRRYLRLRVRSAAERLHAPRGLSDEACRDWLLERLPADGQRDELAELLQRAPESMSPGEVLQVAGRVHEITEERPHVVS